MSKLAPNHRYYQACHGAWRCALGGEVRDAGELRAAVGWLMGTTLWMAARWPRWLIRPSMHTTVVYDGTAEVVHTTKITWLGVPLMWSTDIITLGDDGRSFAMDTRARALAMPWRVERAGGPGEVNEDAAGARYSIEMFGAEMVQTTVRQDHAVEITQLLPGYRATHPLQRVR